MSRYVGSEQWVSDVEKARGNWSGGHVTVEAVFGEPVEGWKASADEIADPLREHSVRVVEATAGTGSRYTVVVTPLPEMAARVLGAPLLVSVLHPWQAAYPMQPGGELHASYVAEKLCGDRMATDRVYGGDLAALTLTVAHALGRTAVL